jgi:hypothetical protein
MNDRSMRDFAHGNELGPILVHSVPLDTPLARLVTADPGTEMIEHDLGSVVI